MSARRSTSPLGEGPSVESISGHQITLSDRRGPEQHRFIDAKVVATAACRFAPKHVSFRDSARSRRSSRFATAARRGRHRVRRGERLKGNDMVTEIATLAAIPGHESDLEEALAKARPIFERAKGCKGVGFRRSIETPGRYLVIVEWETLEAHTVDFRGSEDFRAWRALVTPFLTNTPVAEHGESID